MKIRRFMSISILLIGIIVITGCNLGGSKDDSSKHNIKINSEDNIKANAYINYDNSEVILYMQNNNSYNIGSLEIEVVYYDKDGNKIDEDNHSLLGFKGGSDSVVSFYLPTDKSTYESYVPDKTEFKIYVDQEYQNVVGGGTLYDDKIETSNKVNGNNIDVTFKNNSGKDLRAIDAMVLFMKDKKPIAIEEVRLTQISSSVTETVEIPEYFDENKDEYVNIKYDSIKVVINRAIEEY